MVKGPHSRGIFSASRDYFEESHILRGKLRFWTWDVGTARPASFWQGLDISIWVSISPRQPSNEPDNELLKVV